MVCKFPDCIQVHIFYFGIWEPNITSHIIKNLQIGDTFIDVGSNIGYYTLLASQAVGNTGLVISIEPSKRTFRDLLLNLQLNNVENVRAFNVAISHKASRLPLYSGPPSNIGASTINPARAKELNLKTEEFVDAVQLCDILDRETLQNARFIKIDVEGSEWTVVRELEKAVEKFGPKTEIILEVNNKIGKNIGCHSDEIVAYFTKLGFATSELVNTYTLDEYLPPRTIRPPLPLSEDDFSQKDLLFFKQLGAEDS